MKEKGVIVALDVGMGRVGVAASDSLHITANPVTLIQRDGNEFEAIKNLVKFYSAKTVVIGLPKTLKGVVGSQAEKVLTFVNMLKGYLNGVEIILWDERFTSVIAHKMFKSLGVRSKKERATKDVAEALLILQSYLNYGGRKKKLENSGE
ncbi:MAG: Holliday junction resolvase RuvX [Caldisericota bacterium]|nr:Holliday junction resolvase RuvX [Caldisericota bacterium]